MAELAELATKTFSDMTESIQSILRNAIKEGGSRAGIEIEVENLINDPAKDLNKALQEQSGGNMKPIKVTYDLNLQTFIYEIGDTEITMTQEEWVEMRENRDPANKREFNIEKFLKFRLEGIEAGEVIEEATKTYKAKFKSDMDRIENEDKNRKKVKNSSTSAPTEAENKIQVDNMNQISEKTGKDAGRGKQFLEWVTSLGYSVAILTAIGFGAFEVENLREWANQLKYFENGCWLVYYSPDGKTYKWKIKDLTCDEDYISYYEQFRNPKGTGSTDGWMGISPDEENTIFGPIIDFDSFCNQPCSGDSKVNKCWTLIDNDQEGDMNPKAAFNPCINVKDNKPSDKAYFGDSCVCGDGTEKSADKCNSDLPGCIAQYEEDGMQLTCGGTSSPEVGKRIVQGCQNSLQPCPSDDFEKIKKMCKASNFNLPPSWSIEVSDMNIYQAFRGMSEKTLDKLAGDTFDSIMAFFKKWWYVTILPVVLLIILYVGMKNGWFKKSKSGKSGSSGGPRRLVSIVAE